MVSVLRYGNTNTYFIKGTDGGVLVDTDWAGTLPSFYRALKANQLGMKDIRYVFATHYHPDHMGLISELMKQGVQLIVFDEHRAIRYGASCGRRRSHGRHADL